MYKFVLEELKIAHGRVKFFKLKSNGKCEFDEFVNRIIAEGNYETEIDTIQAIIERKAQMLPVSPAKFKELSQNAKDSIKDYEIVTPNLRVYLFKAEEGKIIVTGAIKSPKTQKQDIARMRLIKKEFFNEKSNISKEDSKSNKNKKFNRKAKKK